MTTATQEVVTEDTLKEEHIRDIEEARKKHSETMINTDIVENENVPEFRKPNLLTDDEWEIMVEERKIREGEQHQLISFDKLYRENNVRHPSDLDLDGMINDFAAYGGYKQQFPCVVSPKANGKYLVLQGNRRTEGLELIQERNPKLFKAILLKGKIPCIVLKKGLTTDEEAIIRNDHSNLEDRKPLNDASQFLAIKQLLSLGGRYTQEQIAAKLGLWTMSGGKKKPNRSYVQVRVNLARLPKEVQEEFLKRWQPETADSNGNFLTGPKSTHVKNNHIKILFTAYQKGRESGAANGGDEYINAWDACQKKEVKGTKKDEEEGVTMMTVPQLESILTGLTSDTLGKFLNRILGMEVIEDFEMLNAHANECEAAFDTQKKLIAGMKVAKYNAMLKQYKVIT